MEGIMNMLNQNSQNNTREISAPAFIALLISELRNIEVDENEANPSETSNEFIESLKEIVINEEKITCSLCLEEFKKGEKCIQLPCKDNQIHIFHKGDGDCPGIITWLKKSNTCPLCRTEFPKQRREINDLFRLANQRIRIIPEELIIAEEQRQLDEAIQASLQ